MTDVLDVVEGDLELFRRDLVQVEQTGKVILGVGVLVVAGVVAGLVALAVVRRRRRPAPDASAPVTPAGPTWPAVPTAPEEDPVAP